jgi:16S rRNA (cytosine967-C5)-methyltransferase
MMFSRSSTISPAIKTWAIKIYPPLLKGITNALFLIFSEGEYADKVVPQALKAHPEWGSRDRKFVAGHIYEIVRWWRYYCSFTQPSAVIDHPFLEKILGIRLILEGEDISGTPAFASLDSEHILSMKEEVDKVRELRESIPAWLDKRGSLELGTNWETELAALNGQADLYIRVNLSRTPLNDVIRHFSLKGITAIPIDGLPGGLRLASKTPLDSDPLYKEGKFEIQDAGSQMIAAFLEPEPGQLIIDACAGAGGKTLHLADLSGDKAQIIAMDTERWKLKNLRFRAEKSRFRSITTTTISLNAIPSEFNGKADKLLLDVPCSGLGILKRNPDTKWKLSENRLNELQQLQAEILTKYTAFVKPGGFVVYATCSILPSENEEQVRKFLLADPSFSLVRQHNQSPQAGFDGFYMALMQKMVR